MQEFFVEKESVTLDSCPIHAVLQSHSMKKQVIRPHIHSAIEFLIVKEGSYDICVDEQRFSAHPGDMVLLRSNTIHHSYSTSEKSSYYVIKVRPSLLAELSDGKADGGYRLIIIFVNVQKNVINAPCHRFAATLICTLCYVSLTKYFKQN